MGGSASQRKGRTAERELSEVLRGYGYEARPGRPVSFGAEPDVIALPGLHIECKRCERLQLPAWFEQSERDAQRMGDGSPVVIFRRNRKPWMIALKLEDFMRYYKP
jgi:Holliday junction resolvase